VGTRNLFEPRRDLVCLDCPVGLVLGEIVMADFQLLLRCRLAQANYIDIDVRTRFGPRRAVVL
jgi:hypothetical protein